ncbi:hypothetical protein [Chloroflexus sp.]|uniref:hypothetical protein n=1 Tax=Chloroflexus sp. TaxID=1904827 RepID=UPI002ADD5AFD|nr:hypothetical protein [Chloroflexus sp.]
MPSGIVMELGGFLALMGVLGLLHTLVVLLKWGGLFGLFGIILLRRRNNEQLLPCCND